MEMLVLIRLFLSLKVMDLFKNNCLFIENGQFIIIRGLDHVIYKLTILFILLLLNYDKFLLKTLCYK